jgi:phytoene dehydrogenase-like protein
MNKFDYVIIGSGLNSLSCAALLAKKGHSVCVLEREAELGGCIKVDRETAPGFTFDLMSTSHVQFVTSPVYAELQQDLAEAGLEYCVNDTPFGVMLGDDRSLVMTNDHEQNLSRIAAISEKDAQAYHAAFEQFGANSQFIFSLLGSEPMSFDNAKAFASQLWKNGLNDTVATLQTAIKSARPEIDQRYESDELRALVAPTCLHGGLSPNSNLSLLMADIITYSFSMASDPLVKGGCDNFVKAFQSLIEKLGGTLLTGCSVDQILVDGNRATGVQTVTGERFTANKGVIANVAPGQLYQQLLPAELVPAKVAQQTESYKHGRGCMIVHLALDEKPQWLDEEMQKVAFLHVTGGFDEINKAISQADSGLLPEKGTICAVQPVAVDPSRAPDGKWILWLQILELPKVIKGDALSEIAVPADGQWNAQVADAYAQRLIDRLQELAPNLKDSIVAKRVLSPADLESMNVNLVGGDPYGGDCSLEQSMMFRPFPAVKHHKTPIKGLYHIGASTHPGPGLGGMSGYLLAKAL